MIKILIKYLLSFSLFGLSFGQVDFNSDIQPIFTNNCGNCHLGNSSGGLNLSTYTNVMSGGGGGAVIIPYDHAASVIYDRITREESAAGDMPPTSSLNQSQIDLIAQWIDEGALEEPGSNTGCTDPEAYNCADDIWIDGEEWPNYTFLVGTTPYINGCNYDMDPNQANEVIEVGGCEEGPCDGFYNPGASIDDGSCDYYQAPDQDDITFTVTATVADSSILVDWSAFLPPENAIISGYNVSRCTGICDFITGNPFQGGWENGGNTYTETSIIDEFNWETELENCDGMVDGQEVEPEIEPNCEGKVKYAINVRYSNAEEYGMAISTSYVTPCNLGDLNGDGGWNVLDIVTLANCVLAVNCIELEYSCAGDLNGDGGYNVLDIVTLANCVLAVNCGGRVDDASEAALIKKDNQVSFEADGFIGGVQMTLSHSSDFTIEMTDRALLAEYLTTGNETRLLVISPETEELFSYNGGFEITEVIVANSQYEVSVDMPIAASFTLSDAYPNPFNPTTTMTLTMPVSGEITVEVYNLLGQVVATLASGYMEASTYTLTWDASNASSGVYFVQAGLEGFSTTQKLMLVK